MSRSSRKILNHLARSAGGWYGGSTKRSVADLVLSREARPVRVIRQARS